MRILLIALVVVMVAPLAYAQQAAESPAAVLEQIKAGAPQAPQGTPSDESAAVENAAGYRDYRIQEEISRRTLILAVICAAVISLFIVLWFLKQMGTRESSTMVNASGLVLVVYATVMVVMIAKAEQQLTAAVGVLGAIAGYLFGTATKPVPGANSRREEDTTKP